MKFGKTKTELCEYLDIKNFIKEYPQFREGQIRWFVVKRNELDFNKCFKKLGRRIYIHVPSFAEWIERQSF